MSTERKLEKLETILQGLERCVVAFSGGVDSTFLLAAAVRALGPDRVVAATTISASFTEKEEKDALALSQPLGVEHALLKTDEFNNPVFTANDPLRCYHCKKIRLQSLVDWAAARGIEAVVEGSNLDDSSDYRPGQQAITELDAVHSPLKDVGLTKAEIRDVSNQWKLKTADKLSNACLATRLEFGLELTPGRLKQVEDAEQIIRPLVEGHLRVRHHGDLARIEVEPACISRLAEPEIAAIINEALRTIGFHHIALDLAGYTMGNMNQGIES